MSERDYARVEFPEPQKTMLKVNGSLDIKAFQKGDLKILVSTDEGRIHMSISHATRYPAWDEIRDARYALLPLGKHFVMALPPPQNYVNLHPFVFHLWELSPFKGEMDLIKLFAGG